MANTNIDNAKKISELAITTNVASSDRILVLYNATGNSQARTITVGNFANNFANISAAQAYTNAVAYVGAQSYVNTSQLSSNLANYALNTSITTFASNTFAINPAVITIVPTSAVNINTEVISVTNHGFVTGDPVVYNANGGTVLGGLTDGGVYYVNAINANSLYLYDNLTNALAGGTTGRKNLTGTGNNNQSLTSAVANVTYDLTGSDRVFVHSLTYEFTAINANFTVSINNNQAKKITIIFGPAIGADADFNAVKVNNTTVTGESLANIVKRTKNTYLNFTIVKTAGVYTIYNI